MVSTTVPAATNDSASRPLVGWWPFWLIAAGVFAGNVFGFGTALDYHGPAAVAIAATLAAPIVIARLRPLLGWLLSLLPLTLLTPLHQLLFPGTTGSFPWLITMLPAHLPGLYLVALAVRIWPLIVVVVITVGAGLTSMPTALALVPDPIAWQGMAVWTLATLLIVVLGRVRRLRRDATVRIAEEQSLRRVVEERTRIARELHDVVAHHLSVIAVQASTAPYRLQPAPSAAIRQEFTDIGRSARESLAELREVLQVLRGETPAPPPGLAALPRLIETVRTAGTEATLIISEPPPAVDPATAFAAYRIVQEGLSNVIKHAPGTAVRVQVELAAQRLRVDVINTAPDRSHPSSPSALTHDSGTGTIDEPTDGHGLIGMRERTVALGGSLHAAPTASGGFAVRAELPCPAPSDAGAEA